MVFEGGAVKFVELVHRVPYPFVEAVLRERSFQLAEQSIWYDYHSNQIAEEATSREIPAVLAGYNVSVQNYSASYPASSVVSVTTASDTQRPV